MKLETRFDGLTLDNPLMPAAGPIVGDARKMRFLEDAGCGAIVSKTLSVAEPRIPKPCIYGDKDYVMNSELWSEHSYRKWVDEFFPEFVENKEKPLIISVGYSKADMETLIPLLDPFADAFEVSTHYVGTDLRIIGETVKTIRTLTNKPFYMKISPHLPDPEGFAKTISGNGANGIVAVNSLGPTMKIDIATRSILYGNEDGFVWTSGPAIKNLALATVYKIRRAAPDLTIIGVGGIESAEDVIAFLLAGANAVQMLSAALLKGKQLYKKIIDDLPGALRKHGFESVEDVIRTTLSNDVDYDAPVCRLIPDQCIECMLCVKICPYFAVSYDKQITFDADSCFRCGLCVSKCPTQAITMEE